MLMNPIWVSLGGRAWDVISYQCWVKVPQAENDLYSVDRDVKPPINVMM